MAGPKALDKRKQEKKLQKNQLCRVFFRTQSPPTLHKTEPDNLAHSRVNKDGQGGKVTNFPADND